MVTRSELTLYGIAARYFLLRRTNGYVRSWTEDTLIIQDGLPQNREFAAAIRDGRPPIASGESVLPCLDVPRRAQDAFAARSA